MLLGLPQVTRQRMSPTFLTLTPQFLPSPYAGLGRLEPTHGFFGKIGQVVWWKNKNGQNGAVLTCEQPISVKRRACNSGVEEFFLVTCHGLGHDMHMVGSHSHHISDAHVFWLILQWQHMNWWSLRYGFPCSANTSNECKASTLTRYLSTTGLLNLIEIALQDHPE